MFFTCLVLNAIMDNKPFLNRVRVKIKTLHKKGHSKSKIRAKCDVSKTAVHRAIINPIHRMNYSDLNRSERPKKNTVRDNRLIKCMAVQPQICSIKKSTICRVNKRRQSK